MVDERIRLPNYLVGTDLGALRHDKLNDDEVLGQLEGLQQSVDDLEVHHRDLTDRVTENEKSFTSFSQQFMPGRTYVQSLLYKLVYDEVVTVPGTAQRFYPGGSASLPTTGATVGFDISNDLQHAFYDISAYTLDNRIVVYNGTIIVGADINVGILRVYKSGPSRLESFLCVYNLGVETDLHIKVYRKIGIS